MKTYWETPTSNLFNTANWSGGTIPGANDIVALTVAGNYTVTSNTNHTVLGVTTGSGATLSISLSTFTATEGTATGANAGTITLLDGSALRIGGIFDNTGLINLGGNTTSTKLAAMSNTTFEGGGRIQMTDDVFNFFGVRRPRASSPMSTTTSVVPAPSRSKYSTTTRKVSSMQPAPTTGCSSTPTSSIPG